MRKFILVVTILIVGLNTSYGQTKEQIKTIVSASLKERNIALLDKINESNNEKEKITEKMLNNL